MRFLEVHAGKRGLQVWNIEHAAEKRHEQVRLFERLAKAIFRQILAPHKTSHAAILVQADDRHVPVPGGLTRRLDVEVERAMPEGLKETPMIPALQAGPEKIRSSDRKPGLRGRQRVVI